MNLDLSAKDLFAYLCMQWQIPLTLTKGNINYCTHSVFRSSAKVLMLAIPCPIEINFNVFRFW